METLSLFAVHHPTKESVCVLLAIFCLMALVFAALVIMTIASGLSLLFVSFAPRGCTRVLEDELPWDQILGETPVLPIVARLVALPDEPCGRFAWLTDKGLPWLRDRAN